jgi:hypothetical protein
MGENTAPTAKNHWNTFLEVIKVGVPVVTLVFGYFIYGAQAKLQGGIDANSQILADRLAFQSAVREEFYKRRLDAYEAACKEMAATIAALNSAGTTPDNEIHAFDIISKFEQVNKGNTLYWSPTLQSGLDDFWGLGLAKLQDRKWDDPKTNDDIEKMVVVVHRQMKTDLSVPDISSIMNSTK